MIFELSSALFSYLTFIVLKINYIYIHVNRGIYISFLSASSCSFNSPYSFMAFYHRHCLTKSQQNLTGKPKENIEKPTTAIFGAKILESGRQDRYVGGNIYWQEDKKSRLRDSNPQNPHWLHSSSAPNRWATTGCSHLARLFGIYQVMDRQMDFETVLSNSSSNLNLVTSTLHSG